jgi:hypothetical protein
LAIISWSCIIHIFFSFRGRFRYPSIFCRNFISLPVYLQKDSLTLVSLTAFSWNMQPELLSGDDRNSGKEEPITTNSQ